MFIIRLVAWSWKQNKNKILIKSLIHIRWVAMTCFLSKADHHLHQNFALIDLTLFLLKSENYAKLIKLHSRSRN